MRALLESRWFGDLLFYLVIFSALFGPAIVGGP